VTSPAGASHGGSPPAVPGAPASLSLVVCTRDRAGLLAGLLASVAAASKPAAFELVVVDHGSVDGTAELLAAWRRSAGHAMTVVPASGGGLAVARNAGVAAATGELVAFTDDDCRLAPDHLLRAAEAFGALGLDLCGGRILAPPGAAQAAVALALGAELRYFPPGRPLLPGDLQGANLVARRTLFDRVGRFDEDLGAGTPFRCEDIEWCARAVAAGARAAHVPAVVVHHAHGRDAAAGRALEAANDRARGAYFALRLAGGDRAMARAWADLAVGRLGRRPHHLVRAVVLTAREVGGALAYLRHAMRRPERSWARRTSRPLRPLADASGDGAQPRRAGDGAPARRSRRNARARSAAGGPGRTTTP
jgi:glycosyltransferase involved in cell wall biosynthesis